MLICNGDCRTSDTDWLWEMGGGTYFGTSVRASDGSDTNDVLAQPRPYYYRAVYNEYGVNGWSGQTGFYSSDIRAPLPLQPGQSKTWRIYIWSDVTSPYNFIEVNWGYNSPNVPAFQHMQYTLTYVRQAVGGSAAQYPVGYSILLNGNGQGGWRFPEYRTTNGLDGYIVDLTATVVPEPSALAVLGVGLAGVVIGRKRR